MSDEINTQTPAVEIVTPAEFLERRLDPENPPELVADLKEVQPIPQYPANWADLTDSQKLDILHMKVDSIGQQVAWIGSTFQGLINMVGNVGPMDIFKMMKGGK